MTDFYVVSAADGTRKQVAKKQRFGVSPRPAPLCDLLRRQGLGSYAVATGTTVNQLKNLGVNFYWDTDHANCRRPGVAGGQRRP
jgi:hypothetical protein